MKQPFPLALLLICLLATTGYSQDENTEEPLIEASPVLFPFGTESDEVELLVNGSWKSTLSYTASYGIDPFTGKVLYPYGIPGFSETGLSFVQNPDLFASVVLKRQFYFTAGFTKDLQPNHIRFAYYGKENAFLESLIIGNSGFFFPQYPYLPFGISGTEDSRVISDPGITAVLQGARSKHHLLLKAETSDREEIRYSGKNLLKETVIDASNYIRGRFYNLPDSGIDDTVIYIEGNTGTPGYLPGDIPDGSRYRLPEPGEAVVSEKNGTVAVSPDIDGRILIFYRKNGEPIGSTGNGKNSLISLSNGIPDPENIGDFYWNSPSLEEIALATGREADDFRISLGGTDFLLLRDPGFYSPFEAKDRYYLPDTPGGGEPSSLLLVDKHTGLPSEKGEMISAVLDNNLFEGGKIIRLIRRDAGEDEPEFRYPESRYPLLKDAPLIYGIPGVRTQKRSGIGIAVRNLTPVEEYNLGTDIVPGTVTLYRNGVKQRLFDIDYETGLVTLYFSPSPGDILIFTFRRNRKILGLGDISFASANRFSLSENDFIFGTIGFRWNLTGNSVSDFPGEHTGGITFSAGTETVWENGSAQVSAGISYTNPDTAGLLRLGSMTGSKKVLPIFGDRLLPSAAPGMLGSSNLLQANRGRLYYKDYSQETAGGATLNRYDWDIPDSQVYPYESGEPLGPYTASVGTELNLPVVLVMDFTMEKDEYWVGGRVSLPSNKNEDFSGYSALSFYWKPLDAIQDAPLTLYFQIGALDEDTDGDKIMDSSAAALSGGYPFNDQSHGIVLAGGIGGIDNEDLNENGLLEGERREKVLTREIDISAEGNTEGWRKTEIILTEDEKQRLSLVRGYQIILVREGSLPAEGRILFSGITLEGSSFYGDTNEVILREVPEDEMNTPLKDSDGDLKRLLPDQQENTVLKVTPQGDNAVIQRHFQGVNTGSYRNLSFYLLCPAVPPGNTVTIDYTGRGIGISGTFSLPIAAQGSWQKVTLDLENKAVLLSGSPLTGSTVTSTGGEGILDTISAAFESFAGYTIYLDEFHLGEPIQTVGAGIGGEVSYFRKGPVIAARDIPIVSNFNFTSSMELRSKDFFPESETENPELQNAPGILNGSAVSEAEIGIAAVSGDFNFTYSNSWGFAGGHTLTIPSFTYYISFTDSFLRSYGNLPLSLSRSNTVFIGHPEIGTVTSHTESTVRDNRVTQKWQNSLLLNPTASVNSSTNLTLVNTADGLLLGEEGYPVSWIQSYRLLLPFKSGTSPKRESELSFTAEGGDGIFSLSLEGTGSSENTAAVTGIQENSGNLFCKISLRDEETTGNPGIDLGYSRDFSFDTPSGSETFIQDWNDYFHTRKQPYIYKFFPLSELYSIPSRNSFAASTLGLSNAYYKPSFTFTGGRTFGYGPIDLFIPVSGSLTLYRELHRRENSLADNRGAEYTMTFKGVNLFGAKGSDPVFTFYNTGSYTGTFSAAYEFQENTVETGSSYSEIYSLGWISEIKLVSDTSTVSLKGRINYTDGGHESVSSVINPQYSWSSAPPIFGSALLREMAKNGARLVHEESFRINSQRSVNLSFTTAVLSHATSYTLPNRRYIKILVQLAAGRERVERILVQGEPPESRYLSMFGFSIGLEGSLTY